MIDLTTDNQDNSTFITSVELNDDLKTYTITYADGHTEEKVFDSVHNYNATLYRMDNQYYQYRDSFSEEMNVWYIETLKKSLIELFLAVTGIILTVKFVPGGLIKTLLIILMILFTIGYQALKIRDFITIGCATDYLDKVGKFLNIKEKLKVPITDPNNGKKEDWYMVNLSNINLGTNIGLYEQYAEAMEEPGAKEEQGRLLTKALKGE
jgi:hypothetical protein